MLGGPNQFSKQLVVLDYCRGFAALNVVFFHFFYKGPTEGWLKAAPVEGVSAVAGYGYLGVNLFFMISGFVIALSAQNKSAARFAASRIIRLLPASTVCASLTALVLLLLNAVPANLLANWLASLTLVPSWFGYPGVDAVYWSLRIELHFYIAVAAILLFQQTNRTPVLIAMWLGLSLLNALVPIWRLDFLLCLSWAPYLAAGVIFFSMYTAGFNRINGTGLLFCFGLSQYYGYKSAVHDGYEIPIVSCAIILMMFLFFAWVCQVRPNQKPNGISKFFGSVTYPLYLFHQVVGYALFNAIHPLLPSVGSGLLRLALIAFLLGCSYCIHRLLEKPLSAALKSLLLKRNFIN